MSDVLIVRQIVLCKYQYIYLDIYKYLLFFYSSSRRIDKNQRC